MALVNNLVPTFSSNVPANFFAGKMETFLTCWKIAAQLHGKSFDEATVNFFEEAALNAVYKTLSAGISIADVKLLLSELAYIIPAKYPAVKNIRQACIQIIQSYLYQLRGNVPTYNYHLWREYHELSEFQNLLKAFDKVENN